MSKKKRSSWSYEPYKEKYSWDLLWPFLALGAIFLLSIAVAIGKEIAKIWGR